VAAVKLEVFGWIAAECGRNRTGSLPSDQNVPEGATVGDLLRQVAQKDLRFKETVFSSDMTLQSNISIVLNGKILGQPSFLESKIKEGDTVMLLPAIDGG
jgi:molybdopterin converting factor small subunit